jgi:hypothetical protein
MKGCCPCYRRERANGVNLKKSSLAVVWANFLFFKATFLFCIFCMFPYFLLSTISSATIVQQFCDI